jgi:prolipoprotein diacylglyceryltransferase
MKGKLEQPEDSTRNKTGLVLDSLARTRIVVCNQRLAAFQVCGCTGLLCAIALGMALAGRTGLSCWVAAIIAAAAMATFLVVAFATKIITGEEQLIYYHQEIAVVMMSAAVARLLHRPVLPYMDVTILGVGIFLACGRLGCLMVGCCHGRPSAFGIRYREEHAEAGLPRYLVGVRLFPVQIVESFWVLLVVICGAIFVVQGKPPGSALAFYTIAYGAARFAFEFVRGDTKRPYTFGFSQGQWISLWLMGLLVWSERSGRIPSQPWHIMVVVSLPAIMLLTALWRKLDPAQAARILDPHHVSEVAGAIDWLGAPLSQNAVPITNPIAVARTSRGFHISEGTADSASRITHYTFSSEGLPLNRKSARVMAHLVLLLQQKQCRSELVAGGHGVFHLVLSGIQGKGSPAERS